LNFGDFNLNIFFHLVYNDDIEEDNSDWNEDNAEDDDDEDIDSEGNC